MSTLWQLYDDQGRALRGQGGSKEDIFGKGLLHGASHVWIWRTTDHGIEILLQKRAHNKRTWPDCYDISAAGHIDLGEDAVTAALRETKEEIGLDVSDSDLRCIGVVRARMVDGKSIENEFQWLYLLELTADVSFTTQEAEVAALEWLDLDTFEKDTAQDDDHYVPHGRLYYQTVVAAIREAV